MNFSIIEVHDELYLVTLVDFPAATTTSILDQVKSNGSSYACVTTSKTESFSYAVYEIYGKNVKCSMEVVEDSLYLAMGC